jgi:hypothetical protein
MCYDISLVLSGGFNFAECSMVRYRCCTFLLLSKIFIPCVQAFHASMPTEGLVIIGCLFWYLHFLYL